jgi:hypothetical protein
MTEHYLFFVRLHTGQVKNNGWAEQDLFQFSMSVLNRDQYAATCNATELPELYLLEREYVGESRERSSFVTDNIALESKLKTLIALFYRGAR